MKRNLSHSAFTLVELLVVIGIIAVLLGVLLPSLSRARESGNRAKCLSNVRQLAAACIMYAAENDGRLPDAMWDNSNVSSGSPYSPRGSKYRGYGGPYAVGAPIADTTFGIGAHILPSIGGALLPYLGDVHRGLWTCPDAPNLEVGRAGAIYHGADPYDGSAGTAALGATDGDRWLPNYHYMCMKGYYWHTNGGNPASVVTQYGLDDWMVRNVAGLPTSRCRSVTGQGSSQIVLFREELSTNHTPAAKDIYDLAPGERGNYASPFSYLDGHAEFVTYHTVNEYFAAHSDPIPQTWYNGPGQPDWQVRFSAQFAKLYRAG